MTHYLVIIPAYETVIPILDDGTGPSEWGSDVLEVEALNASQAKVLAVREWRRQRTRWVSDQDTDCRCPFTGLQVRNMDLGDEEFNRRYHA